MPPVQSDDDQNVRDDAGMRIELMAIVVISATDQLTWLNKSNNLAILIPPPFFGGLCYLLSQSHRTH